MLRKTFLPFMAMALFNVAKAQTDTTKKATDSVAKAPPPVTITGSVDAYYRFNFSDPKIGYNNYTSFTNSQNSFELGMASIRGDHSFGKVGATLDLGFGRRAEEFSYNDGGHPTLFAVKQAFLTFQATSALKFTMGKWGTHIGYEVLDAYANRNYSMDYMFSEGPFFHTGLKADITLSPTTAIMVGIANPHDFSTTSSSTKEALAQFSTGTKDGKLKFFLNYMGYGGANSWQYSSMNQFDIVINATVSSKFGVGFNGTLQTLKDVAADKTKNWGGAALYLNFDPTSTFGLTLRGEYFSDKDGTKITDLDNGEGLSVFDLTLSGLFHVGSNLTIIPEIRLDNGSKNLFYKSDATTTKSTISGILAAVYHF